MEDLANSINSLLRVQDTKIEPLLVELLEQGKLDIKDFVISNKGIFTRCYLKEVMVCNIQKWKNKEYLEISVNREGIYDMLPKMVFHKQEQANAYDTIDRYLLESQKESDQEAEARKFFLPIEQEFYKNRIEIESEERILSHGFENPLQQILFSRFWSDTTGVENEFKDILLYLLPLSHKIAGNDKALEGCVSTLLGEQVSILRVPSKSLDFSDTITTPLGGVQLGVDWILGGEITNEIETLVISINYVNLKSIPNYLPGGPKARLLKIICDSFVPFELEYLFHIQLKERANGFAIDNTEEHTRLGYSTVLN